MLLREITGSLVMVRWALLFLLLLLLQLLDLCPA